MKRLWIYPILSLMVLFAFGCGNDGEILTPTDDSETTSVGVGDIDVAAAPGTFPSAFEMIDFPSAIETRAIGINNRGQIVGDYEDSSGTIHAFLLDNGVFNSFDFLDATSTDATTSTDANGINDRGQIVGGYTDGSGPHGFLLDGGNFTTIDAPDAVDTKAFGINDRGQIVGFFESGSGDFPGYLLDRGNFTDFTDISFPGAFETQAFGINNSGQIVGQYDGQHGFLLDRGELTTIDFPGADETEALGINNAGQIVGFYRFGFEFHGFLWERGNFTTLDVPFAGAVASGIVGISDAGKIVGGYADFTGTEHGFTASRGR